MTTTSRSTSLPRRRTVTAALAMLAVAGLTAACGTATGSGDGGTTLRIVMHQNAPTDAAIKAINAAFEQENPGVTVDVTFVPTDKFDATRSARLAAKNVDITEGDTSAGSQPLPGYVKGGSESDFAKNAAAGNWVDLGDQAFLDNYDPEVLERLAYQGKQYQVPTGIVYYTGVFYNKSIFEAQGLQVPTTWQEFVTLNEELVAAGITPMVIGGKDQWPAGLVAIDVVDGLYPTAEEKQALDRGLWSGSVKLTDPKPTQVLERVKAVYDFTDPNFPGIAYNSVPGIFARGEVAMLPDGSWQAPSIDAAKPDFEYGYFPLPAGDDASANMTLRGKLDVSFVVPTSSKNREAALKWLEFFSEKENYADYVAASGFAPVQPDIEGNEFLKGIRPYTQEFELAWDQYFHANPKAGSNATYPFNYLGLAPVGPHAEPAAAAEASQRDWAGGLR